MAFNFKGLASTVKEKASDVAGASARFAGNITSGASQMWEGTVASSEKVAQWAKSVPDTIDQYAKNFNADEMWQKISSAASKAGQDVIVMVLTMYYSIEEYIKKLKK